MRTFGLIGRNISYSFSRKYFSEKFETENIDAVYRNFDLGEISEFPSILKIRNISGMNVTIPYKQDVMSYLDDLHSDAREIDAVNVIKIEGDQLIGYNTDHLGFQDSIKVLLKPHHKKALILGTGGASKAVAFALKNLQIDYSFVSRNPGKGQLSYEELNQEVLAENQVIINTTPLGTFPNIEQYPDIPYEFLTPQHLAYDLIYNPAETKFLQKASKQGSDICNGLRMLQIQAEKAWEIWNS
ncbi:MAG: shikimate dehydrogenase [Christiangramia sp.]|uniref:shikimate dehydrogenase family protein n=1 Tax=Christiangramia sp. TaxID=1931228 RepID=UPI00324225D2